MRILKSVFKRYSTHARAKRGEFLRQHIILKSEDRILDLGGGEGSHFHSLFPKHHNVVIADILSDDLAQARDKFGYETVQLAEDAENLPFNDKEFDFLFCSSVIEHVTGPKEKFAWMNNGCVFEAEGKKNQWHFACEIRRIAKRYYVQTPYRYFLIESHSWLPGVIVLLPRTWLTALLRVTNRFWTKKTAPDWRLLTIREFRGMFPDAEIHCERSLGLVKSLMAIKAR